MYICDSWYVLYVLIDCVCVCVGFIMCGYFDNCVGVYVICVLVFTVFVSLYCVFVLYRLCIFMLICSTATE
jgi:hypothetical protein